MTLNNNTVMKGEVKTKLSPFSHIDNFDFARISIFIRFKIIAYLTISISVLSMYQMEVVFYSVPETQEKISL